ncbi:MAG: hypothetical protein OEW37_09510, partial [Rhodospirillaceae bacterium]|nr:hypothetical protein [Rhodospirillaceae bacterium]
MAETAQAQNGATETVKPQSSGDGTSGPSDDQSTTSAENTASVPAEKSAPAPKSSEDGGQFAPVILKKRYQINPGKPLPEFDGPSAKAFEASDQRDPSRPLYAMVSTPALPPRINIMSELKNLTIHGLISLVEYGPIEWEPLGQNVMITVFERPLGGRLIDAFPAGKVKVSEYELSRRVLEPITQALIRLRDLNISHRAIRIENLYFLDSKHEELVLGECVTTPCGYDQPNIYEPVERGLAMNSGRGHGTILDDLYALGVMATLLLLGRNPVEKLSDEVINAKKMELGTYQALCGEERIPMALIEPLRGLLSDKANERWDTGALEAWINGQKKTPMQRRPLQKPKEPYSFAGKKLSSPRTIAQI